MAFRSIMALAIPGLKLDVCSIFCFIFLFCWEYGRKCQLSGRF